MGCLEMTNGFLMSRCVLESWSDRLTRSYLQLSLLFSTQCLETKWSERLPNWNKIKQELKPYLKVISKTARHAETGLKVLAGITAPDNETQDGSFYVSAAQAQDLMTIFTSQTAFLQSEYSSLVVKSTFNADTSRIFRQFETNSTAFTESALRNARLAAELSARDLWHVLCKLWVSIASGRYDRQNS